MNDVWLLFDDEQITELIKSFSHRIEENRKRKREYTSLQKILYELRHEMMARARDRKLVGLVNEISK